MDGVLLGVLVHHHANEQRHHDELGQEDEQYHEARDDGAVVLHRGQPGLRRVDQQVPSAADVSRVKDGILCIYIYMTR